MQLVELVTRRGARPVSGCEAPAHTHAAHKVIWSGGRALIMDASAAAAATAEHRMWRPVWTSRTAPRHSAPASDAAAADTAAQI